MKPSQIQKLQDLRKCWMLPGYKSWVAGWIKYAEWDKEYHFNPAQKADLRRLTHQYRHQIRAMKRNGAKA